jgi:L1 cell adhesion molecule like protein
MNMGLFNECIKTVESCLTDAKMDKSRVDDVVLVGGSSRIPKVQQLLQDFFNGKELCKGINPDEAVAYGAAVQAALLSDDIKNVPKLVLQDVTPLSLGRLVQGDIMSVVIPRNTCIPVKKTLRYVSSIDNQTRDLISVYEGERARASDNDLIGSFLLQGIPAAPRGSILSEVCFAIDENGILTVSAKNNASGTSANITITNHKERLSNEEIKKLIQEAENYHMEDMKFLRKAKMLNKLDDRIYKLKNILNKKDMNSNLSEEIKNIKDIIAEATNMLDEDNKDVEIDILEDYLKKLEVVKDETHSL